MTRAAIMAGEWLKFEANTPEKPEVFTITVAMGWDDPDLAVGKLLKVWRWFDQQTIDGNAPSVTLALLDRISGVSGFAKAMCDVGWLASDGAGLRLPNFDRHNGKTAKDRCLTAKRVAKHKTNATTNAAIVSPALPKEEKRREETDQGKDKSDPAAPDAQDGDDKGESAEKRKKRRGTEDDAKAARWMYGLVLTVNATAKQPNWDVWADEVRLMREIDGRTHAEICELFQWAKKDAFWCSNIQSPSKLREKWDQLTERRAQPERHAGSAPQKPSAYKVAHLDHRGTEDEMRRGMERRGTELPIDGEITFD